MPSGEKLVLSLASFECLKKMGCEDLSLVDLFISDSLTAREENVGDALADRQGFISNMRFGLIKIFGTVSHQKEIAHQIPERFIKEPDLTSFDFEFLVVNCFGHESVFEVAKSLITGHFNHESDLTPFAHLFDCVLSQNELSSLVLREGLQHLAA